MTISLLALFVKINKRVLSWLPTTLTKSQPADMTSKFSRTVVNLFFLCFPIAIFVAVPGSNTRPLLPPSLHVHPYWCDMQSCAICYWNSAWLMFLMLSPLFTAVCWPTVSYRKSPQMPCLHCLVRFVQLLVFDKYVCVVAF